MAARLFRPTSEEDWRRARQLVEEYAASLDVDLSFQDFAHELEHLAAEYGPPAGAFLLAEKDGAYLGCVGLRRFAERIGEMKRLYVVPEARDRGLGRLLAVGVIDAARELGHARLRLDTLPSMKVAQALYLSLGFKETQAYRHNPVHGSFFFELDLRQGI